MDELERVALTSLTDLLRQEKAMEETVDLLHRMMKSALADRAVERYNWVAKAVCEHRDPPTLVNPGSVPSRGT